LTAEADTVAGFTVYNISSEGTGFVKYKVTCKGQTFELAQIVTDSTVFEKKNDAEGGASTKYGISLDSFLGELDSNGQLLAPTDTSYALRSDEILRLNSASVSALPKTNLTEIDLPNLVQWGGGTFFSTFQNCASLTSVSLGISSLTPPGMMQSFQNCTALKRVELPNLADIGESSMVRAFLSCTALEYVNLSGLKTITSYDGMQQTFQSCTSLKYVDMSNLSSIANGGVFS